MQAGSAGAGGAAFELSPSTAPGYSIAAMSTPALLDAFPAGSKLRPIVERLLSDDAETRADARDALGGVRDGALGDAEALAVLRAAVGLTFPPEEYAWEDSASELLVVLWSSPLPGLAQPALEAYATANDAIRSSLLALLAAIGTREAAQALVACVRAHGWPSAPVPRIFRELGEHGRDFADVLFPALLENAGDVLVDIGNIALGALATGALASSALAPVAPMLRERLSRALAAVEPAQRADGVAWRFDEEYRPHRSEAGFLLDFGGWLVAGDANEEASLVAELRRGAALADPWPALFATLSLIRARKPIDDAVIQRLAASNETRAVLFVELARHDLGARFPREQATLDAMAAADVVGWLIYPTELGREPDVLQKMATFESNDGMVLYVWRFLDAKGEWCAAVSGPYPIDPPPGPVHGSSTFSRFEAWDSASAEEHAERALSTLADWRKSWEHRGR
jgi:hypothetical protein